MAEDHYVTTGNALAAVCDALRASEWVAVDTEFVREKTYYPNPCLVQVAVPGTIACIDVLALDTLDPLLELLYDRRLTKVFHAAQQDLEIFFLLKGGLPTPVFDTQIAAGLAGYGEQVGYANLVARLLGRTLDKSQTRTDWAARPLDARQLRYASDDVRYLCDIYQQLVTSLKAQGRLEWLAEDFARLADPRRYLADPSQAWRRIKGHQRLARRELAALRALAEWREHEAMAANVPRKRIFPDTALLDVAAAMPSKRQDLDRLRSIPARLVKQWGQTLVQRVAFALTTPQSSWPSAPSRAQLKPEQEAVVDLMMALVRHQGSRYNIAPGAIASRHALERLLAGDRDLLSGWRSVIVGRELEALLCGRLCLGAKEDRIEILTEPMNAS